MLALKSPRTVLSTFVPRLQIPLRQAFTTFDHSCSTLRHKPRRPIESPHLTYVFDVHSEPLASQWITRAEWSTSSRLCGRLRGYGGLLSHDFDPCSAQRPASLSRLPTMACRDAISVTRPGAARRCVDPLLELAPAWACVAASLLEGKTPDVEACKKFVPASGR